MWGLGLVLLAGMGPESASAGDCCYRSYSSYTRPTSSSLLFNASPSRYDATQFTFRSDWPSTPTYYQSGQVVAFREYFHDQQGSNSNPSWTYRRFDTYRSGVGYR
jgi:hypothetical protein